MIWRIFNTGSEIGPEVFFGVLEKVRRAIADNGLLREGEKVILGFSGGIDSVCLAHVLARLTEYRLKLWAVYVNYGLRPDENRLEEDLLRETGEQLGIETIRFSVNIPERIREKSQSVQLLAREERYRIFQDFRAQIGADKIALAHHCDDQAETIFYRIIRGTGLDGLAGMPIIRDKIFIRPLLTVSRAEIRKYALENRLKWVEDSSNQKTLYRRNRIRHRLIPDIEEAVNPRFKDALLRLGKLAGEHHEFMENIAAQAAERVLTRESERLGFPLGDFLDYPRYFQYYFLKYVLDKLRPDIQLETAPLLRLRERLNSEKNRFKTVDLYKGVIVYLEDQTVFCACKNDAKKGFALRDHYYLLACPGVTDISEVNLRITIEKDTVPDDWTRVAPEEAYLPLDIRFPLNIRFWHPGDRFWPLGAGGSQKIQDFFVNRKIPRRKRGEIPLLTDAEGNIVWIAGYRLDERYKIGSHRGEAWHVTATPLK